MATASNVAKHLLSLQSEEAGDLISNLKLQKLAYYCQGLHLAIYDRPLFGDPIEAWTHGPVVRHIYDEYKSYGSAPIPVPSEPGQLEASEEKLLNEVYEEFGQFSAWKLREMTHDEPPFKEAERTGSKIISHESMRSFFKSYLIAEHEPV